MTTTSSQTADESAPESPEILLMGRTIHPTLTRSVTDPINSWKDDEERKHIIKTDEMKEYRRNISAVSLNRSYSVSPSSKSSLGELTDKISELSCKMDDMISMFQTYFQSKQERKKNSPLLLYDPVDLLSKIQVICETTKISYHGRIDSHKGIFYLIKDITPTKISHFTSTYSFPTTEYVEHPMWICDNCNIISQTDTKWEFECHGHTTHVPLQQLNAIMIFIYNTSHGFGKKIAFNISGKINIQKLWRIKTILDNVQLFYHGVKNNSFFIDTQTIPMITSHNINDTVFTFGSPVCDPIWFCNNSVRATSRTSVRCTCNGHMNANVIRNILDVIHK